MKMLIGGELVDSSDGRTMPLISPYTKKIVDYLPCAGPEDIQRAIETAQVGFTKWSAVCLGDRIEIMRRFRELYKAHEEELAQLLVEDMGKPISQARFFVEESLEGVDTYVEQARFIQGDVLPEGSRSVRKGDLIVTTREPLGVVVCIIPFNYPITMTTMKVIPALVMGNSVIIKPPSTAPRACLLFCQLLIQAGVPTEACQLVTGKGEEIGTLLCEDPRVAKVSLTGSTSAGIKIAQACAKNLTRSSMELGGNDAFIVLENCDLAGAVQEAYQCRIQNAGQTCIAPKRLIVQERIKDEFIRLLIEKLENTIIGDPTNEDTQMGPLVSREAAMRVEEQIKMSLEQGGKLLYGGSRYEETFVQPTVIEADSGMDVAKDMEIFGPVFTVIPFESIDEAIQIANASRYGLNGGVYGNDIKELMYVARRLKCGSVVINGSGCVLSKEQPFGGWKMSGNGCREGGRYVLEEMSQIKTLFFEKLYQ